MLCNIHDISRPLDPSLILYMTLLNTTNDVVAIRSLISLLMRGGQIEKSALEP